MGSIPGGCFFLGGWRSMIITSLPVPTQTPSLTSWQQMIWFNSNLPSILSIISYTYLSLSPSTPKNPQKTKKKKKIISRFFTSLSLLSTTGPLALKGNSKTNHEKQRKKKPTQAWEERKQKQADDEIETSMVRGKNWAPEWWSRFSTTVFFGGVEGWGGEVRFTMHTIKVFRIFFGVSYYSSQHTYCTWNACSVVAQYCQDAW